MDAGKWGEEGCFLSSSSRNPWILLKRGRYALQILSNHRHYCLSLLTPLGSGGFYFVAEQKPPLDGGGAMAETRGGGLAEQR